MTRLFGHDQNLLDGEEIMVVPPDGATPRGPFTILYSHMTREGRVYRVERTEDMLEESVYDIETMRMNDWLEHRRRTAN